MKILLTVKITTNEPKISVKYWMVSSIILGRFTSTAIKSLENLKLIKICENHSLKSPHSPVNYSSCWGADEKAHFCMHSGQNHSFVQRFGGSSCHVEVKKWSRKRNDEQACNQSCVGAKPILQCKANEIAVRHPSGVVGKFGPLVFGNAHGNPKVRATD